MNEPQNMSNYSVQILNDVWALQYELNDPDLTVLDVLSEYIERNGLCPDTLGEILAKNKMFVKILENDLVKNRVFRPDKPVISFDEWEIEEEN
jgi:hypothetical protein